MTNKNNAVDSDVKPRILTFNLKKLRKIWLRERERERERVTSGVFMIS